MISPWSVRWQDRTVRDQRAAHLYERETTVVVKRGGNRGC